MPRHHYIVPLILCLILCPDALSAERVKIGVSTALTGPAATFGNDLKNAVLFANNHIGGGRYDIIVEDDQCSPNAAVRIANKFTAVDDIHYVFGNCSATVLSTASIYERAGAYLFAPIATSQRLSSLNGNVIRMAPNDRTSARKLYEIIAAKHKVLGVLTESSDYSVDFENAIEESNRGQPLYILNEEFATGTSDFRSLLLRLKKRGIDSLFINSNTEESFLEVLSQLQTLDIHVPLYGAFIPGSASFQTKAGENAGGISFIDFPVNEEFLSEEGKNLYALFVKEYGAPAAWEIGFALTFEAFRLLDRAVQTKGATGGLLTTALHGQFSGIFGRFSFDAERNIQGIGPVLRTIGRPRHH